MAKAKKTTTADETSKTELDTEPNTQIPEEVKTEVAKVSEIAETLEETEKTAESAAKAGKRSAKALKEAEELQAKEERKARASEAASDDKPRQPVTPTRSRLERRGKKFREAAKLIDKTKQYSLAEAVELAQKTSPSKFDATLELHINLGVDPRQADQNIRDNLVLPAGTGKSVRVAVFDDEKVAGADLSGVEAITKQLEKSEIDFDVLIATPAQMSKLGKYARMLGPRGLMPNPKSGTVTTDLTKAVKDAKAGRVEYRVDATGIVHLGIGKVSFTKAQLLENAQAVVTSIKAAKPASLKGTYLNAIHLTTSMGPSITVSASEL